MQTDAVATSTQVDVAFPLSGQRVPRDHGYALLGALGRVLGDVHGASWLAVHPIRGVPMPDGTLALRPHNLALRLRVEAADLPRILPLAGQSLEVDGHKLLVGVSRVFALESVPHLAARMVTIKGFTEPEPFVAAVQRQLDALGVRAEVACGRRRVLTVRDDVVVGYGLKLHGLSPADSLKVQTQGLGGRRRFGCGVFTPVPPPEAGL